MNLLRLLFVLLLSFTVGLASIGKIALAKGDVSISRNSKTISVKSGAEVFTKDIISTSKKSKVQIKFEDNTVITLGGNSEFKVIEYINDAKKPKAKFGFAKGTFKAITGQIGKIAPKNFKLETRTATIGIRGTIVVGKISKNEDTIGCLLGAIEVKPLGSDGSGVFVGAGKMVKVGNDGTPPQEPTSLDEGALEGDDEQAQEGTEETPQEDNKEPVSEEETTQSADNASQTNLDDGTTDEVNEFISSQGCPANSVGTYPNCQKINTSYESPDYWTVNLNAASTNETKALTGYSTGIYIDSGTAIFMFDGILNMNIDGTTETISTASNIYFTKVDASVYKFELGKTTNSPDKLTYKNINKFSITDFSSGVDGWLQSENTETNEYVSWGYWQHDEPDPAKLLPVLNFWVAGVNAIAAKTYVSSLNSTYTYSGKSIGYVYDGDSTSFIGIDAVNNNTVSLNFDFGSGTPLQSSSYIQFQTNETTPEVWKLNNLTQTSFSAGTFIANTSLSVDGNVQEGVTGQTIGTFYGDEAQAVGGSFGVKTGNKIAVGVYKAVKP